MLKRYTRLFSESENIKQNKEAIKFCLSFLGKQAKVSSISPKKIDMFISDNSIVFEVPFISQRQFSLVKNKVAKELWNILEYKFGVVLKRTYVKIIEDTLYVALELEAH